MMRSIYLNRLGITEWRLREAIAGEAFFQVQLKNAQGKRVGVIIAETDSVVSLESQAQLLRKIAEAITAHYDFSHCESPDFFQEKYRFIIFLGKKVGFDSEKTAQIISSHTLSELTHHASMKKTLWSEIKKLRDLFNE